MKCLSSTKTDTSIEINDNTNMKVLNANKFVSERLKVKPITNVELDKVKQEMESRTTTHELPLEYENIIKEGNIVFCFDRLYHTRNPEKHIVMSGATYNKILSKSNEHYCTDAYVLCTWDNDTYWACEDFKEHFPMHFMNNAKILKIIDAGIDLKNVNSVEELQNTFNRYRNIQ